MADENKTLTEVFGDIADAIRAKGVSGTMTPAQMPTNIGTIGGDTYGLSIDYFLGDKDQNGELGAPSPSTASVFGSNRIISIPANGLYYKF